MLRGALDQTLLEGETRCVGRLQLLCGRRHRACVCLHLQLNLAFRMLLGRLGRGRTLLCLRHERRGTILCLSHQRGGILSLGRLHRHGAQLALLDGELRARFRLRALMGEQERARLRVHECLLVRPLDRPKLRCACLERRIRQVACALCLCALDSHTHQTVLELLNLLGLVRHGHADPGLHHHPQLAQCRRMARHHLGLHRLMIRR